MLKIKIIILLIIIVVVLIGTAGFFYTQHQFRLPASSSDRELAFIVKSGEGVKQIAKHLEEENLIKSSFYFELYVWKEKLSQKLQAGEYLFRCNMTIPEIVEILVTGKVVSREVKVTIPEGLTIKKIGRILAESELLSFKEFWFSSQVPILENQWLAKYEFLKGVPQGATLEGFLFPDTYSLYKDATPKEILEKMLDNFDRKFTAQMCLDIERQGKSIYEIITMASLLEKEVRTYEDRQIVSGIFSKRVENNYPLESCATIAYILGADKWRYSYEDTRIKSPYNTYLNIGLPPSPICNPGLSAIKAAIYPEESDYHYFLSRPDTGQTVFSKTLKEHNINKTEYLK